MTARVLRIFAGHVASCDSAGRAGANHAEVFGFDKRKKFAGGGAIERHEKSERATNTGVKLHADDSGGDVGACHVMQETFVGKFEAMARLDDGLSIGLSAHHFLHGGDSVMHGEKFADVFFGKQ